MYFIASSLSGWSPIRQTGGGEIDRSGGSGDDHAAPRERLSPVAHEQPVVAWCEAMSVQRMQHDSVGGDSNVAHRSAGHRPLAAQQLDHEATERAATDVELYGNAPRRPLDRARYEQPLLGCRRPAVDLEAGRTRIAAPLAGAA